MSKNSRIALWTLLVERGIFPDRKVAESWIMAGKVIVNEQRVDVGGERVPRDAEIRVKGLHTRYVGRGGLKLEGALSDFGIDVSDKVALDAGACTGGFTDCLLQHGASKVYAIDVGFGQLAGNLRVDTRVVNMERTNIGSVTAKQLNPVPGVATLDLSYLSLKTAIPGIAGLLSDRGDMLCLVKPLFEVADASIRRNGVIAHRSVYEEVLSHLVGHIDSLGLLVCGVTHSHVTGSSGTREFFIWASKDNTKTTCDYATEIHTAVDHAIALPDYRG